MYAHDFYKVIRVEPFDEPSTHLLAQAINEWVSNTSVEIVDIKYNSVITDDVSSCSALVLYRYIDLRKEHNIDDKSIPVPPENMVGIDDGQMG